MAFNISSIGHQLSEPIPIFGMKLWVAIIIGVLVILVLILIIVLLCRKRRKNSTKSSSPGLLSNPSFMDKRLLSVKRWDIEANMEEPEKQVMYCDDTRPGMNGKSIAGSSDHAEDLKPVVSDNGSVNRWTLREIEEATGGLVKENVIGTGDHGIVFRGLSIDNTQVVVKKLYSSRSRVNGFVREAEAMLLIRHKNLARLMGYCAEGRYRMLVYEYVDNGNLSQWLHQSIGVVSPLSWKTRVKIIIGIAKGLAYLHEDIEPVVIHQSLKSTNILVDKLWNPKISDYGVTKLLGPEWNQITAPPMRMIGYAAPELTKTSLASTKSDVYSFGVLVLEIVSGKTSTYSCFEDIEEFLVDWVKANVSDQNYELVLDPRLPENPPIKELKRILLIALRCVDFEVENRPKMGEIIHMLEPRDLLLIDEHVVRRQTSRRISSKEDQF